LKINLKKMASKAIGHVWFNGRSQIGIVMTYDDITKKAKAYIHTYVGLDDEDDIRHIMDYGTKFPVTEARALIEGWGTITDAGQWLFIDMTSLEAKIEDKYTENTSSSEPT
jgi:hypothetical protein